MNTVAVRPGWAERHATEFPAVKPVAAPVGYEAPSDPWGTQPMPVVPFEDDPDNKIAPGTRAAIEQQRAADVIDESRAPYHHAQRPVALAAGFTCIGALGAILLLVVWMWHGAPSLIGEWSTVLMLVAAVNATFLPLAYMHQRANRTQAKDEHQ